MRRFKTHQIHKISTEATPEKGTNDVEWQEVFCIIRRFALLELVILCVCYFLMGRELANFKDFIELKSIEKDRRFLQLVRKKMVMIKELLEIQ